MQPSDSSPVCMPIVRLLPSWAGPTCRRTQVRSPRFQRKDVSTCMGSSTARGSSSASQFCGEDVAFRPTARRQHLEIRPVSQLNTQPVVSPVNASSWSSRAALASLGAGAAGYALRREGLSPPILSPAFPGARRIWVIVPSWLSTLNSAFVVPVLDGHGGSERLSRGGTGKKQRRGSTVAPKS